jgi:hypothetical protein
VNLQKINYTAADTDPRREPARFVGRLARRVIDRKKGE